MADLNEVKIEGGSFGNSLRTAQPTHGLRWGPNGILQQAWLVVQCGEVNQEISRKIEWRNVPNVPGYASKKIPGGKGELNGL